MVRLGGVAEVGRVQQVAVHDVVQPRCGADRHDFRVGSRDASHQRVGARKVEAWVRAGPRGRCRVAGAGDDAGDPALPSQPQRLRPEGEGSAPGQRFAVGPAAGLALLERGGRIARIREGDDNDADKKHIRRAHRT